MRNTLVDLETRFWQSMVDQDTDTALSLLCDPAVMVSAHGAMKFDHEGYRKMAEQGTTVLASFKLPVRSPEPEPCHLGLRRICH
jgi:hypothetical protein